MKVIILGSDGMLGNALKENFVDDEVFGFDKNDLDLTDIDSVRTKIEEIKPDFVINASAINAVDDIETKEETFEIAKKVNGEVVGNLAEICNEFEIPFVHYSSDYVFPGENQEGHTEDFSVDPVNKYGETKALGEKLVQDNTNKFYLIRLSRLFGNPGTSEMTKKSFVDVMLDLVINKGKTELDLVDDEKSCPTYVRDLAGFTRNLIEGKKPFGIYHGANSGACTWYEFAKEIFQIKNIEIKCNLVSADKFPRPAARPHFSELVNTKTEKQRSWQEALREYLS